MFTLQVALVNCGIPGGFRKRVLYCGDSFKSGVGVVQYTAPEVLRASPGMDTERCIVG